MFLLTSIAAFNIPLTRLGHLIIGVCLMLAAVMSSAQVDIVQTPPPAADNIFNVVAEPEKQALQQLVRRWQSYMQQLEQFNGAESAKQHTAAKLQGTLLEDVSVLQQQLLAIDLQQDNWSTIESYRLTIHYLISLRMTLWESAQYNQHSALTGFSATALNSAKTEASFVLKSLWLHLHWLKLWSKKTLGDIATTPIPQVLLCLKLAFFAVLTLLALKFSQAEPNKSNKAVPLSSLMVSLKRWLFIVRRPVVLGLFAFYSLSAVYQSTKLPEAELLLLLVNDVFIAYTLLCIFQAWLTPRESFQQLEDSDKRAIYNMPRWLFVLLVLSSIKNDSMNYILGGGTISGWLSQVINALFFIYLLFELYRRNDLLKASVKRYVRGYRKWDKALNQKYGLKIISSCAAIAILMWQGIQNRAAFLLKKNENAIKLMAYWSRQEISKLSEDADHSDAQLISDHDAEVFLPPYVPEIYINYADEALEQIRQLLYKDERCFVALTGSRGLGKSSLLKRLEAEDALHVKSLSCPYINHDIYQNLAGLLGVKDYNSIDQLNTALKKQPPTTISLDDCQRLILPSIGGLDVFESLITLMSESSGNISWIMAFETPAWQFFTRVRGERIIFDRVIELPKWNEAQILSLINKRCKSAEIKPDFSGLFLPSQETQDWLIDDEPDDIVDTLPDDTEVTTKERRQAFVDEANKVRAQMKAYVRVLWDFSGGNPSVCLWAWRRSLFRKIESGELVVGLFKSVDATELDRLPNLMLFVLKTVMQMEKSSYASIATATNLPEKEVSDAVRYLLGRDYIDRHEGQFSINPDWFRPIHVLLVRQHLLQDA